MAQGGRNSSCQFRNLQVHGESLQSTVSLARKQHVCDSDEHDWWHCLQTQRETLQDFELELVNPKGPVWNNVCGVTLLDFYWAMSWLGFVIAYQEVSTWRARVQTGLIWRFRWRNVLMQENFRKQCETRNFFQVQRVSQAHGHLLKPGKFPCTLLAGFWWRFLVLWLRWWSIVSALKLEPLHLRYPKSGSGLQTFNHSMCQHWMDGARARATSIISMFDLLNRSTRTKRTIKS